LLQITIGLGQEIDRDKEICILASIEHRTLQLRDHINLFGHALIQHRCPNVLAYQIKVTVAFHSQFHFTLKADGFPGKFFIRKRSISLITYVAARVPSAFLTKPFGLAALLRTWFRCSKVFAILIYSSLYKQNFY
jgi:hypothetical protein